MGGDGGFSAIPIISELVFGGISAANKASSQSSDASSETAAEVAAEQAEARRRADRKKAEAALLTKARQADRAEAASRDAVAETLGAPSVAATQLKGRLGQ